MATPRIPATKRVITFIDGQNLYRCAKDAFGYHFPNYDVQALSKLICAAKGWRLDDVRFYTGYPSAAEDPMWNDFWTNKLAQMGRTGITVFKRDLRYHNVTIDCPGGQRTERVPREKGVDVRIAIDLIRLAFEQAYDIAVVFSQDQDLSEAAEEVRKIAAEQSRWVELYGAYPTNDGTSNNLPINHTLGLPIRKTAYDLCLDAREYRSNVEPQLPFNSMRIVPKKQ